MASLDINSAGTGTLDLQPLEPRLRACQRSRGPLPPPEPTGARCHKRDTEGSESEGETMRTGKQGSHRSCSPQEGPARHTATSPCGGPCCTLSPERGLRVGGILSQQPPDTHPAGNPLPTSPKTLRTVQLPSPRRDTHPGTLSAPGTPARPRGPLLRLQPWPRGH